MKHFNATRLGGLAAAAAVVSLAVCGLPVRAQTADSPVTVAAPVEPAKPAVAVAARNSPFGAGAAVGMQRLTGSRGGASTTTTVDIGGVVKDATATNVATGNNAIRDGSFANAVGFNTVIQNSGANVLIQNSMTVNVQFK